MWRVHWSSTVASVLPCPVWEILKLYAESHFFPYTHSLFRRKFRGVPFGVDPWCWSPQREENRPCPLPVPTTLWQVRSIITSRFWRFMRMGWTLFFDVTEFNVFRWFHGFNEPFILAPNFTTSATDAVNCKDRYTLSVCPARTCVLAPHPGFFCDCLTSTDWSRTGRRGVDAGLNQSSTTRSVWHAVNSRHSRSAIDFICVPLRKINYRLPRAGEQGRATTWLGRSVSHRWTHLDDLLWRSCSCTSLLWHIMAVFHILSL